MMNSVAMKRHHNFEDYHLQSKILVTEKVFTSRSSLPDQIKSIHDKTLQKLFQGAKKQQNAEQLPTSTPTSSSNKSYCPHLIITKQTDDKQEEVKKYRQMQLNASGQLVAPNFQQTNSDLMDVEMSTSSNLPQQEMNKCSYCDCPLYCSICKLECQNCYQIFCPQCCLNVSRGFEDAVFCLSCVP